MSLQGFPVVNLASFEQILLVVRGLAVKLGENCLPGYRKLKLLLKSVFFFYGAFEC